MAIYQFNDGTEVRFTPKGHMATEDEERTAHLTPGRLYGLFQIVKASDTGLIETITENVLDDDAYAAKEAVVKQVWQVEEDVRIAAAEAARVKAEEERAAAEAAHREEMAAEVKKQIDEREAQIAAAAKKAAEEKAAEDEANAEAIRAALS